MSRLRPEICVIGQCPHIDCLPDFPKSQRHRKNLPFGLGFRSFVQTRWSIWVLAFRMLGSLLAHDKPMELAEFFKTSGFASVPLQLTDANHLWVRGQSGTNPFVALIDTGAVRTLISPALATDLAVLDSRPGLLVDFMGISPGVQKRVRLPSLTLGSVTLSGCPAMVVTNLQAFDLERGNGPLKRSRSPTREGPVRVNMFVGWDSLVRWGAWLDVGHPCHLYFPNENPRSHDQASSLGNILKENGFDEVPLANTNKPWAAVLGSVNKKPVRFLIDSGAPFTLLDSEEFGRLSSGPSP